MNEARIYKNKTQIQQIIDLLIARGDKGVLLKELQQITACHKSKLSEIRKRGYDYKILNADTVNHRYVLTKKPSEDFVMDNRKALDIFLESTMNEFGNDTAYRIKKILEEHNFKIHRSNALKRFAKE
jgi:hypothetical protein